VRGALIESLDKMNIHQDGEILNPDPAGSGELIVSVIRYEDPVSKQYGYQGGKVTKGQNHRSKQAVGETIAFRSFSDFADWRKLLPSECMLPAGTFEVVGKVKVGLKGKEGPGEVSATNDYLAHRQQPGLMIGDIDFKEPGEVCGLHLGDNQPYRILQVALDVFSKILPEADDCALLIGWSTSSNLFRDEVRVKDTGGIRLYLPVTDASKIPDLLDIMHKRSWARGAGWAFVDKAGRFQERSFFDMALARPAQPDYAAPDLRDGLTQDREWHEYEGMHLDPAVVAPLTSEEEALYLGAIAIAKTELAPAMAAQRGKWLKDRAQRYEKEGLDPRRAKVAAAKLLDDGVLYPAGSVMFDDGTEVSVAELLNNGEAHDGKTCKDPVEPDYNGGATVGKYYWNDGEEPGINSFAHGQKWHAIKHDGESAMGTVASDDANVAASAFALCEFSSGSEQVKLEKEAAKALGLGNNVSVFRADIAKAKQRLTDRGGKKGLDDKALAAISNGLWPLDKPLPLETFQHLRDGKILSHADNYKTMMTAYGYGCSYDVIKKEVSWTGPEIDMNTDNAHQALFSKMKGLAALSGLPHGSQDLQTHLPAIAEQNQINPVRDYLSSLAWDGQDRIQPLVQEMEPCDAVVAEIAMRVWITGAAAACDHFEIGLNLVHGARPSFEYVLCLLGGQGINKTKGFLDLIPKALSKYAKEGLTLNPKSKDSVKIVTSNWLVELGELDATFRQAQIAELKAFLSTETDELRLPYAQGYSKFKRRTAFIGTVNHEKFLKDPTGNRRYLVLECTHGFPGWPQSEVDQLWAQAWKRYTNGEQWWPTDDEQLLLDENAERYRQYSWAETRIREKYDFTQPHENNRRLKTTALYRELLSEDGSTTSTREYRELRPQQLAEVGNAMKKVWAEFGAHHQDGELVVDTGQGCVKVNSGGGKNKGWLVPMTVDEVSVRAAKAKVMATKLAEKQARIKTIEQVAADIVASSKAESRALELSDLRDQVLAEVLKEPGNKFARSNPTISKEWEEAFDEADVSRA
jgi:predicted P-loop ATPase